MKRRAGPRAAVDADAAAHELRELAADGEPEPAAAEAPGSRLVRLSEGLEDLADRGRIHADARVAHRDIEARAARGLRVHVRLDDHLALGGELDGVADQIHEDLPHPQRIAPQRAVLARRWPHDQLDALGLGGAREQAGALLEHLAEIERQLLERDLAGIDLGQIQQVVDDLQQHPGRGADGVGEARLGRGQGCAREELGHADHAVHRRAQLVAHAIEKVALGLHRVGELAVALGELPGAQLHLRLQTLPGAHDALELQPLQAHAVGERGEGRERVGDAGPPRFPRRRVAMDGEPERRAAPDRIGVRRPHLEQMIAGLEVGERDAPLRAEVEPAIGQARHAVGETVALRGCEVERAEIQ